MARYIYFQEVTGAILNFCDTDKYSYNEIHPEVNRLYIDDDEYWESICTKFREHFVVPADSATGVFTYIEFVEPVPEEPI